MQPDMQTPMQPPVPPAPPRRRSVVGPVILIILGLAFLAQNLGLFDWNIWGVLWRLWPVWLIAVGLDLLIGRRTNWGSWVVVGLVLIVIGGALWFDFPTMGGAFATGEPVTISEPARDLKQADITIDSSIARLEVTAGKSDLMVEGLVTPLRNERIQKDARNSGDTFVFTLKSHTDSLMPVNLQGNAPTWDLQLSDQVPMRLSVDTGVGETNLDLTGLQLTSLKVNAGVGETDITLPATGQFKVEIDAGVGEVMVRIPKGMAARIRADQGIGQVRVRGDFDRSGNEYLSPGYGGAANRVEIEIDGGVGEIHIEEI